MVRGGAGSRPEGSGDGPRAETRGVVSIPGKGVGQEASLP